MHITRDLLIREYITLGKTDRQIAQEAGFSRSYITHLRRDFGIAARVYTGERGEMLTAEALTARGYQVRNMNRMDKCAPYDLLVNGQARVEVKAATAYGDRYAFQLAQKPETGISPENRDYLLLPNGRWKKDLNRTCDILILCCLSDKPQFYILPPGVVPIDLQTLRLRLGAGKWEKYRGAWGEIDTAMRMAS